MPHSHAHVPSVADATQLRQITKLLLDQTTHRPRAQDITLEISDAAIDWLAKRGYQPEFGARPLRRTIQRELDNRLSKMLLDGQLQPGQTVNLDVGGDRLALSVTGTPSTARKEEKVAARAAHAGSSAGDGGGSNGARAQKSSAHRRDHSPRGNGRAKPETGPATSGTQGGA